MLYYMDFKFTILKKLGHLTSGFEWQKPLGRKEIAYNDRRVVWFVDKVIFEIVCPGPW